MLQIKIHPLKIVDDNELTRVVCVSKYKEKWVYAKHKERGTWEIPGGHIEENESWEEALRREMYEETGAIELEIEPICLYSISTYGILCYAEIKKFEKLPDFEMEEIGFFDEEPKNLTYKESHHLFLETVKEIKQMDR